MTIQQAAETILYAVVAVILAVATYTDIKERKIFNRHVTVLFAAGFAFAAFNIIFTMTCGDGSNYLKYPVTFFGGMLIVAAPMLLLAMGKMRIGGGDIKLCAGMGCCIGAENIVTVFFAANVLALLKSVFCKVILKRKITMQTAVPMAPYIAAAYVIVIASKAIGIYC